MRDEKLFDLTYSLVVETIKFGVHGWGFEQGSDYNITFSPTSFSTFPSFSFPHLKVGLRGGLSKELWCRVYHFKQQAGRTCSQSNWAPIMYSLVQFCHLQNGGEKILSTSQRERTSKTWKKPNMVMHDHNRRFYFGKLKQDDSSSRYTFTNMQLHVVPDQRK